MQTILFISALVTYPVTMIMSLYLLEAITSVRVELTRPGIIPSQYNSIPMMFSGMVRTVHPPAHAVSSTTLHGLQRIDLPNAATKDIELRICADARLYIGIMFILNSLNSMCNDIIKINTTVLS